MKTTNPNVDVLGIPLYASDIQSASGLILQSCSDQHRNNYCVSATGAHGMVFAKKNKSFERVLKSFFINLPDGKPGVWIGRIKGVRTIRQCTGPDFFKKVMIDSRHMPVTHFFCGGNDGVADNLKVAVREKFGNENIAGTFCPPFSSVDQYDYKAIAGLINHTRANILWIGMSTPKQELFAQKLSRFTNVNFLITVGAAFDFHTGRLAEAPALFQNAGLEWFFRLMMEPRRLYKRYMEIVPMFIYYNVKELITSIKR